MRTLSELFRPALMAFGLILVCSVETVAQSSGAKPPSALTDRDSALQQYLLAKVDELEARTRRDLADVSTWLGRAPKLRKELLGMLGLDPLPARGDLHAVVSGQLEHPEFVVEKIHFQSLPGLYVTGNLYLPKQRQGKLPAVLYVCGHSVMKEGSVSFGNKTGYQHHPAWFARNGFACLAIDTIQLGEIAGIHHGTNRLNLWWWNSKGYTPAGVETWNGMRALDYLASREEIDAERLGVTGRSGGGAYSWYIAAVDERVKAAVPVAGITDLRNHVVDGVIDGHCDCMYMLNTKKWDFSKLAALVAPRPLLIANTDKDSIFPVDGIERIHRDVAGLYKGLGAADKLGLLITEGPHKDTQELQAPAFRWFKRFLANSPDYPAPLAEKLFPPARLRVFDALPADERTSTTHDWFVPPLRRDGGSMEESLRKEIFPDATGSAPRWTVLSESESGGRRHVLLGVGTEAADRTGSTPMLLVSGSKEDVGALIRCLTGAEVGEKRAEFRINVRVGDRSVAMDAVSGGALVAKQIDCVLLPRGSEISGIGDFRQDAWSGTEKDAIRIRRRFMLLGETLDSVHVRDQVQVLNALARCSPQRVEMTASGAHGVNAVIASILTSAPLDLRVGSMPDSLLEKGAPDHFNLLRVADLPEILKVAQARNQMLIAR